MRNSVIRRVIILGALGTIGILTVQGYWVYSTYNLREEAFDQSVKISLVHVAEQLAAYDSFPLPNIDLVEQKATNYYVVNINNVIDAGVLELFLLREFEKHALKTSFEYAIYDCASNEFQYGNYCNVENINLEKVELGNLPKYEEYPYYFVVKFPNKRSYLVREMPLSILFSILLFIAIAFFIYAMTVILKQRRLSEMQKDFINNMTHEFKTPISTIRISADVFKSHALEQKDLRLLRYANIIKEQNQRLDRQVEKVLQLAKVEKDGFHLKKEKVDLKELLENILPGVSIRVQDLGGKVELRYQAKGTMIKADILHLANVVHNLLDNAIKYRKGDPIILITVFEEGKALCLRIKDEGIGIPKQHQKRIFDKFFRVPTGDLHDVKGFGIGLYYVHQICRSHGWKISLESQEGQGTVVNLFIPKEKEIS